jgi:phage shock protein PspC (stress-responsive transcriptional regulator)
MQRKLARSRNDKMIAGVCGGFAEYFGWTPWLVRFVYVLVSLFSAAFPGVIIYLLLWLLMPKQEP